MSELFIRRGGAVPCDLAVHAWAQASLSVPGLSAPKSPGRLRHMGSGERMVIGFAVPGGFSLQASSPTQYAQCPPGCASTHPVQCVFSHPMCSSSAWWVFRCSPPSATSSRPRRRCSHAPRQITICESHPPVMQARDPVPVVRI